MIYTCPCGQSYQENFFVEITVKFPSVFTPSITIAICYPCAQTMMENHIHIPIPSRDDAVKK